MGDRTTYDLDGLTLEEASNLFPSYQIRVTREDGESLVCTRNYRTDRINVHTVNGKIKGEGYVG